MQEKKIYVEEDLVNYIEKLDYEQNSIRRLLIDAAERGIQSTSAFSRWEEQYKEAFMAFEVAKIELEKKYIRPYLNGGKGDWTLDYDSRVLTIGTEA